MIFGVTVDPPRLLLLPLAGFNGANGSINAYFPQARGAAWRSGEGSRGGNASARVIEKSRESAMSNSRTAAVSPFILSPPSLSLCRALVAQWGVLSRPSASRWRCCSSPAARHPTSPAEKVRARAKGRDKGSLTSRDRALCPPRPSLCRLLSACGALRPQRGR